MCYENFGNVENSMKTTAVCLGVIAAGFLSTAALAQTVQQDQQRDVNQQQRIEQRMQSDVQRQQQHVDKMQANDLRNGSISPSEQARLNAAQNRASADIAADKQNGVTGNPNSASSQRMQSDVQRNVNQQQRIANGVSNGSLRNHEVGSLERGQAHVDRKEANAAANGHVGAGEQRRIQGSENHQSARVYRKKHNARPG
jgi:hypothetical protein